MPKHYWDKDAREWIEYDHLAMRGQSNAGPYIVSDLPAYKSPLGNGLIDGRAARREELKRSGCREVDPSEYQPLYHDKSLAKRLGKEWAGPREIGKRLPTTIGPDVFKGEQ